MKTQSLERDFFMWRRKTIVSLRQCQTKSTTSDRIQILSSFNDIGWSPDAFVIFSKSNKWKLREFQVLKGIFSVEEEDDNLPKTVSYTKSTTIDRIKILSSFNDIGWYPDTFSENLRTKEWKLRKLHVLTRILYVEREVGVHLRPQTIPKIQTNDPNEPESSLIPFGWSIDACSERTKSNKWKFDTKKNHYWSICVERNIWKYLRFSRQKAMKTDPIGPESSSIPFQMIHWCL